MIIIGFCSNQLYPNSDSKIFSSHLSGQLIIFVSKKTVSPIMEKTEIKELVDNCFKEIIEIISDKEKFEDIKEKSFIIKNSIIIIFNKNNSNYEISKFCLVEPKRWRGKK